MRFLLWVVLLALSWPLALVALVLYPVVWVLGIPFRIAGISAPAALELIESAVRLPACLLVGPSRMTA